MCRRPGSAPRAQASHVGQRRSENVLVSAAKITANYSYAADTSSIINVKSAGQDKQTPSSAAVSEPTTLIHDDNVFRAVASPFSVSYSLPSSRDVNASRRRHSGPLRHLRRGWCQVRYLITRCLINIFSTLRRRTTFSPAPRALCWPRPRAERGRLPQGTLGSGLICLGQQEEGASPRVSSRGTPI